MHSGAPHGAALTCMPAAPTCMRAAHLEAGAMAMHRDPRGAEGRRSRCSKARRTVQRGPTGATRWCSDEAKRTVQRGPTGAAQ